MRKDMPAKLILEDKTEFFGFSFGFPKATSGEVVFNTGMVGYPETLTDPSYAGQILVLTYPLAGNYGVPDKKFFESYKIHVRGLVVSEYCQSPSHHQAKKSLADWLKKEKIPAIFGIDTRALTKKLREKGVMLGKIIIDRDTKEFFDPNKINIVSEVSLKKPVIYGRDSKKVIAIDCGIKENCIRSLVKRGVLVKRVPWNYDFIKEDMDGLFISNGPGDPKMCKETIINLQRFMEERPKTTIFGICLGNQILGLAAGAKTYKLKFGHRAQNQPVEEVGSRRCFVTAHNHGFSVDEKTIPDEWSLWFRNLNDKTVEGIRHKTRPWFSVQFHPEAAPGPTDTEWIFDEFISLL